MPAGFFDVPVPTLRDGATRLGTDAGEVGTAGTALVGAATGAGGGVNGGPLAAASADLATALGDRCTEMQVVTGGAGATLSGNAALYDAVDGSASTTFGASVFGGG